MRRIDRLTPEQEAMLPVVRDEWLAHGLATGPADREEAVAGVRAAYEATGLEPPPLVVWLDSPLAGAIGTAMLRNLPKPGGDQVWDQVRDQVWVQVGDQVRDQVRDQVWAQVGDQVWAQVGAQVWDQVWVQVGAQVRDQVWVQVGTQVGAQVWDQVGDQVHCSLWGQHDAGWLAWCDVWQRVGLDAAAKAAGLCRVGRSAGWWWALRGAVVLTERPTALHRDAEGRLHCVTGPAIAYPDGWGVWAWHGVRVERDVIEHPEAITVGRVHAEQNAERRRVMVERIGYQRYLKEAGAREVHRDDYGVLWRAERSPDDEALVLVEVVNSTAEPDGSFKRYFLRVPPSCRRAREAVAWTFGVSEESYVLEVAT